MFESSNDQWCTTTSLISVRTGQPRSIYDSVFRLFRSQEILSCHSVLTDGDLEQVVWSKLALNSLWRATYVVGCGMPWLIAAGALPIKCSEPNAMSMPLLGVNVVSIGAPISMFFQTRKNKGETGRRIDSAQFHNSLHGVELRLRWCISA